MYIYVCVYVFLHGAYVQSPLPPCKVTPNSVHCICIDLMAQEQNSAVACW